MMPLSRAYAGSRCRVGFSPIRRTANPFRDSDDLAKLAGSSPPPLQTLPVRLERSRSHQQSSVGLLLRPLRHPILGTRVRIADRFAWNSLQRSTLSLLLAASRSYRFWKTEHLKRVESWGLKACPATLPLQTFEARLRFWLTSHRFIPCGRDLSVPPQTLFPSQTDKDVRATTILRLDLADR